MRGREQRQQGKGQAARRSTAAPLHRPAKWTYCVGHGHCVNHVKIQLAEVREREKERERESRYDTIQYGTIRYDTIRYDTIHDAYRRHQCHHISAISLVRGREGGRGRGRGREVSADTDGAAVGSRGGTTRRGTAPILGVPSINSTDTCLIAFEWGVVVVVGRFVVVVTTVTTVVVGES